MCTKIGFLFGFLFGSTVLTGFLNMDAMAEEGDAYEKKGLGMHEHAPYTTYYKFKKSKNTDDMKEAFPTPETRAPYTSLSLAEVDANINYITGRIGAMQGQSAAYKQLLEDVKKAMGKDFGHGGNSGDGSGLGGGGSGSGGGDGFQTGGGSLGSIDANISGGRTIRTGSYGNTDRKFNYGSYRNRDTGLKALRGSLSSARKKIYKADPSSEKMTEELRKEGEDLFKKQAKADLLTFKESFPQFSSVTDGALKGVGTKDQSGRDSKSEQKDDLVVKKKLVGEGSTGKSAGRGGQASGPDLDLDLDLGLGGPGSQEGSYGSEGSDDKLSRADRERIYYESIKYAKRSKSRYGRGGGSSEINSNQRRSVFRNVSRRYRISAYPVFFAPKKGQRAQ